MYNQIIYVSIELLQVKLCFIEEINCFEKNKSYASKKLNCIKMAFFPVSSIITEIKSTCIVHSELMKEYTSNISTC